MAVAGKGGKAGGADRGDEQEKGTARGRARERTGREWVWNVDTLPRRQEPRVHPDCGLETREEQVTKELQGDEQRWRRRRVPL